MAQEVEEKNGKRPMLDPLPKDSDLVRPYDTVKVYSTGSTEHTALGEEMEVHPNLAVKLVDMKKATMDPPTVDKIVDPKDKK